MCIIGVIDDRYDLPPGFNIELSAGGGRRHRHPPLLERFNNPSPTTGGIAGAPLHPLTTLWLPA
jgi:hypothetical protein